MDAQSTGTSTTEQERETGGNACADICTWNRQRTSQALRIGGRVSPAGSGRGSRAEEHASSRRCRSSSHRCRCAIPSVSTDGPSTEGQHQRTWRGPQHIQDIERYQERLGELQRVDERAVVRPQRETYHDLRSEPGDLKRPSREQVAGGFSQLQHRRLDTLGYLVLVEHWQPSPCQIRLSRRAPDSHHSSACRRSNIGTMALSTSCSLLVQVRFTKRG